MYQGRPTYFVFLRETGHQQSVCFRITVQTFSVYFCLVIFSSHEREGRPILVKFVILAILRHVAILKDINFGTLLEW